MKHSLTRPPKGWRSDDTDRRRSWIKKHSGIDYSEELNIAPENLQGIIEHHIGFTAIPTAVASPLVINGDYAKGEFIIPVCTAEGTLVYSLTRGMLATAGNGITVKHFSVKTYYLESGFNSDKKASRRIISMGRGHSVVASVDIHEKTLQRLLGSTAEEMIDWPRFGGMVSQVTGSFGLQLHIANALAAVYVAMGQDIACVAENSLGDFTCCKNDTGDGIMFFQTLPSLTVGTVGGGTNLPAQKKIIDTLARQHSAILGGSKNGQRGYMLTYAIAYIRDFLGDYYISGETHETTVPWNKITDVFNAVQNEAKILHTKYKFPGRSFVSFRITQLYQSGVCMYFTHGLCYKGVRNPENKFSKIDYALRLVILKNGGSISHHHGIGKIRAKFTDQVYDSTTEGVIKNIKKYVDPKNVFGIRNNIFAGD